MAITYQRVTFDKEVPYLKLFKNSDRFPLLHW